MVCLWLALAATAGGADHPSIVYSLWGTHTGDDLGASVAAIDDLDDDGAMDFAVGATQSFFDPDVPNTGYVLLVSGKTGKVIRALRGGADERIGFSVRAFQDLDGDGKRDVLVVNTYQQIKILSSASGALLKMIQADPEGYPMNLVLMSDITGDGIQDFLVGQSSYSNGLILVCGKVAVFSSIDGSLLWQKIGEMRSGLLGASVADVGDIDGDGWSDVAVGEPGHMSDSSEYEGPDRVYILSGRTGKEIRRLGEDPTYHNFGIEMANLGDLDGDGRPEIAIGAPGYAVGSRKNLGWVGIYSTPSFRLVREFQGHDPSSLDTNGDLFGSIIASAGDVDGDGVQDLLIGTSRTGINADWGLIELRSGRTGSLLAGFEGFQTFRQPFASAMGPLGDIDGDGKVEFLIGSVDRDEAFVARYDPGLPAFIRGDANGDGEVDLSDAIALLEVFFFDAPMGPCAKAFDFNGDEAIDGYDPLYLIFYLFRRGWSPPTPFPDCGSYGGFQDERVDCLRSTCSR